MQCVYRTKCSPESDGRHRQDDLQAGDDLEAVVNVLFHRLKVPECDKVERGNGQPQKQLNVGSRLDQDEPGRQPKLPKKLDHLPVVCQEAHTETILVSFYFYPIKQTWGTATV